MLDWYFASGDLGFLWEEQIRAFSWAPDILLENRGFGFNSLLSLWLNYPFTLITKTLSIFGLPWLVIEKVWWIGVVVLAVVSSYTLASYILKSSPFRFIAPLIYVFNTYFLLLFSGGQLGVALAYAFAPWVLMKCIASFDSVKNFSLKEGIRVGVYLAILIAFDLRLAYITLLIFGMYALMQTIVWRALSIPKLLQVVVAAIVTIVVHLYWILPTVLASSGTAQLGKEFTNAGMLVFLSFADFSHSLSLLHPNWPENLFGKVYFMQPEFLLLPILAFASLLGFKSKAVLRVHLVFVAAIALIGAFFAKGAMPPFGGVFVWMFDHVPGFVMFRDPTKFYLMVAIAYAILIPYTLDGIARLIKNKSKSYLIFLGFILFWAISMRGVFMGQVKGNLRPRSIPAEYTLLKDLLVADTVPSRTLWLPARENFAFSSAVHPEFAMNELYKDASLAAVMENIQTPEFTKTISDAGVKYVIVPSDVEQRIFLSDYRFDAGTRHALIEQLEKTSMMRNGAFEEIAVFENKEFVMHADVPDIVVTQERLAKIGAVISGAAFIIFLCILFF